MNSSVKFLLGAMDNPTMGFTCLPTPWQSMDWLEGSGTYLFVPYPNDVISEITVIT